MTGPGERHDKQIVQPFGEYLPWRSFFAHLSSYADRAGYFVPGSGSGVVHAAGVPVGVATCWEVIFDRALRQSVRNGAQVLAVPTNNATFDQAMSEQQLAFARPGGRARRDVIVAGTTGISAAITPTGTRPPAPRSSPRPTSTSRCGCAPIRPLATRWTVALQWLLVVAAVGAIGAAMLQNGTLARPVRSRRAGARRPHGRR